MVDIAEFSLALGSAETTDISFLSFGVRNTTFANRLHHQSSENFLHIGGIDHASTLPLSLKNISYEIFFNERI